MALNESGEAKTHYDDEIIVGLDGMEIACDIIVEHHESCDRSDDPSSKKQGEISLSGGIVAIVDVFLQGISPCAELMSS